ncbi:unnamed protein product [Polarella glacialis]|uniref:Uncharacterized protein n=1 Tax=Polarella glacialis TaxID=89957 RepID=A0A813JI91_POLGL|nr:unnamed protein product [Polarella glacialis]
MPQMVASRRLGVALDFDLTKTPAPVYMNMGRNMSREYRAGIADYSNMILASGKPCNDLDEKKWQGNGFAGHVQYVPYLGREPLRAGVKMERDIQVATMPRENGAPLNVTQMGARVCPIESLIREQDAVWNERTRPSTINVT